MIIVGLHNDVDAGVCLIQDGTILDAVGEERFNRKKLFKGLPELALEYVLQRHNLCLADIDIFAYGWHCPQDNCRAYAEKLSARVVEALENDPSCGSIITDRIRVENERDGETLDRFQAWMRELGVPEDKITYPEHHLSHAWSAFAPSPFREGLVFSMDGRGDLKCATVSSANEKEGIKRLDYLLTFDSLGYLYGKVTAYLGYKPHRHEGKVTGLAAHGDPAKTLPIFESLFRFTEGRIVSTIGNFKPFFSIKEELAAQFDSHTREDIAAGVQAHTESLVCSWVKHWCTQSSNTPVNVCLAGGLFANVRLNQMINELDCVQDIYVTPNMGDGGIALGSALYAQWKINSQAKTELPTVYLGPQFNEEEIRQAINACPWVNAKRPQDKIEAAVEDLVAERVVGYFEGRMEYGPRALGARSIIFHTRDASVNDWLNKRMNRTEFMPFAPVTAEEHASQCYLDWKPAHVSARFMTRTYDCVDSFKAVHKAVVHVDGTARPQIVNKKNNGDYYRIVKSYCEKTGERALINTSFNRHEEPIVCSPSDALGGLEHGMIDVLYLGPWRVTRKD